MSILTYGVFWHKNCENGRYDGLVANIIEPFNSVKCCPEKSNRKYIKSSHSMSRIEIVKMTCKVENCMNEEKWAKCEEEKKKQHTHKISVMVSISVEVKPLAKKGPPIHTTYSIYNEIGRNNKWHKWSDADVVIKEVHFSNTTKKKTY